MLIFQLNSEILNSSSMCQSNIFPLSFNKLSAKTRFSYLVLSDNSQTFKIQNISKSFNLQRTNFLSLVRPLLNVLSLRLWLALTLRSYWMMKDRERSIRWPFIINWMEICRCWEHWKKMNLETLVLCFQIIIITTLMRGFSKLTRQWGRGQKLGIFHKLIGLWWRIQKECNSSMWYTALRNIWNLG